MPSETHIFLYADTPVELAEMLQEIRFKKIAPSDLPTLLTELDNFGQDLVKQGHISLRTNRNVPGMQYEFYESVPQSAADVLNKFQFPEMQSLTKAMMKKKVLNYLHSRGIPLRSK